MTDKKLVKAALMRLTKSRDGIRRLAVTVDCLELGLAAPGQVQDFFRDFSEEYAASKEYKDFWHKLNSGEIFRGDFQRINKLKEVVWLNASYAPMRDDTGQVIKIIKIAQDITKNKLKWPLVIVTILGIALSWGSNFMGLTSFFLDYVPGYNKFRAVSMILVIAELTIPLIAVLVVTRPI